MVFSLNQILNILPNLQISSQGLVELTYFFFNDVEEHEFPSKPAAYSLKSEKGWAVDFAKL